MRVTGVYFSPTGGTKRALETLCGLLGPAELLELGAGRAWTRTMGPDELLTRIQIPAPPAHSGSHYIKYTRRKAMDLALLGVSAYVELDGETIRTVRLALTTAAPIPMRAEKTEALLTGKTVSAALLAEAAKKVLEESHPRSSWRSSAEFRLALLEDMTVQALEKAIARAKEK